MQPRRARQASPHVYKLNEAFAVHQLLAGRDFALDHSGNQTHAFAAQMQNFCYLVEDVRQKTVVGVDIAWDVDEVLRYVDKLGVKLVFAIVTHRHEDHCGGVFRVGGEKISIQGVLDLVRRNIPVGVGRNDLESVSKKCGVATQSLTPLREGDVVHGLTILETPGHTPGSVVVRLEDECLITGDTLFIQSCGRVDLPESDPDQMLLSLARLSKLPPTTRVFAGHNYSVYAASTIGDERENNHTMIQALELIEQGRLKMNPTSGRLARSPPPPFHNAPLLPDYLRACKQALDHFKNSL